MARPASPLLLLLALVAPSALATSPARGGPPLPASVAKERPAPAAQRATVEVRSGFLRLLSGGEERLILPADGRIHLSGGCQVVLSVRADVVLALGELGSARLRGPLAATLEGEATAPRIAFQSLGVAEWEIRRPGVELALPRGQILRPTHSAFRLEGRTAGAVDFEHRAGQAVELDLGGRYSFTVGQGRRIRLPDPLEARR